MSAGRLVRPAIIFAGIIALWQLVVVITGAPPFMLPAPADVGVTLVAQADLIAGHALTTAIEIIAGLVIGAIIGCGSALLMAYYLPVRRWLLPVLVVSQAVPVFALAPLLVLWLGFGLASKIAMAVLIIFFPVTAAFYDGLRRTEPGWMDMAAVMRASRWATLRHIRIPAALPALASGLRVAAAVAPIGAVVGEWVGSSAGLGYLMLHSNARVQVDLMFAALFVLALLACALYFALDAALKRLVSWQPELPIDKDPRK